MTSIWAWMVLSVILAGVWVAGQLVPLWADAIPTFGGWWLISALWAAHEAVMRVMILVPHRRDDIDI